MVSLLENIFQISAIILLLCSFYYYRHFKKVKRERKLTLFELSIYIITQVAMYLCAGSYLLLFGFWIEIIKLAGSDSSRAKERYFAYSSKRDSIPLTIDA